MKTQTTGLFSIFDTRFDTKKIFVTTKHRFSLRTYIDKSGKSLIYLDVSDLDNRIRLNTDIYIDRIFWDQKKQRIRNSKNSEQFNLILENIEARITAIKTNSLVAISFLSNFSKNGIKETNTTNMDNKL